MNAPSPEAIRVFARPHRRHVQSNTVQRSALVDDANEHV